MAGREPKPGEVFAIPVGEGVFAGTRQLYAGVSQLLEPVAVPEGGPSLDALVSQPVVAEILIANHAFAGRSGWATVGSCALASDESQREFRFVRFDAVADKCFLIGPSLGIEWFTNPEEISIEDAGRLEDAAVWDKVHVENYLLARWECREGGFLSTRLRPWQARARREAILSSGIEKPPAMGHRLAHRPFWG